MSRRTEDVVPSTVSASGNVDANLPEPVPIEHAYLLIVRLTDDIIADIHSKRKVEEHHLHQLYSLYGGTLEKALSIVDVDGGNVTLVRAELTGRFLFQVVGSDVRPYTATMHHCSCPAYTNTVVLSTDSLYCKHQLAARICHALGRVRDRVVSEAEFNRLITEDRYRDAAAQHGWHGQRGGQEVVHRSWTSRA